MYVRKKLKKRRSPFETKLYAVTQVIEFNRNKRLVAEEIGFSVTSVINWVKTYEQYGEVGLQSKKSPYFQRTSPNWSACVASKRNIINN